MSRLIRGRVRGTPRDEPADPLRSAVEKLLQGDQLEELLTKIFSRIIAKALRGVAFQQIQAQHSAPAANPKITERLDTRTNKPNEVSFTLPACLKERLQGEAKKVNKSLSEIIRQICGNAVLEYLVSLESITLSARPPEWEEEPQVHCTAVFPSFLYQVMQMVIANMNVTRQAWLHATLHKGLQ